MVACRHWRAVSSNFSANLWLLRARLLVFFVSRLSGLAQLCELLGAWGRFFTPSVNVLLPWMAFLCPGFNFFHRRLFPQIPDLQRFASHMCILASLGDTHLVAATNFLSPFVLSLWLCCRFVFGTCFSFSGLGGVLFAQYS